MKRELDNLKEYLMSKRSEDAKRPLAYSFFEEVFRKKFRIESDAEGADGYVEGMLLVEFKTRTEDWLKGLYQGLHYQKLGLSFPNICVISQQFIGLWALNRLPEKVLSLAYEADSQIPPSRMGRINANKTTKSEAREILDTTIYLLQPPDFGELFVKDIDAQLRGFFDALRHLDKARIQINLKNFIDRISFMQRFFDKPLDAIHCFSLLSG